jgi:nitroreductase
MSITIKRYSVREFKDTKIKEEEVQQLLEAAMQAPSAKNQQPWDFIVVDNPDLLDYLSHMHKGSWPLKTAPLAIIPVMRPVDKSPHMKQQDMGAATENILLEAVEMGLGGVWIGVYPLEERINHIAQKFDFPKGHEPFCIIAIGHPLKTKEVTKRYDKNRVFYNQWGKHA